MENNHSQSRNVIQHIPDLSKDNVNNTFRQQSVAQIPPPQSTLADANILRYQNPITHDVPAVQQQWFDVALQVKHLPTSTISLNQGIDFHHGSALGHPYTSRQSYYDPRFAIPSQNQQVPIMVSQQEGYVPMRLDTTSQHCFDSRIAPPPYGHQLTASKQLNTSTIVSHNQHQYAPVQFQPSHQSPLYPQSNIPAPYVNSINVEQETSQSSYHDLSYRQVQPQTHQSFSCGQKGQDYKR